jgi:HAD superfamily hydrolase (TIGR01549 family)
MGFEFPKDKDAIIQNFNKFAVLHPPDMNKHLVSLIKRFREDNPSVDLAIASSSTREIILSVLQRAGADGYFKTIVADEDIIAHKPDPEMILKVMDRLKIRKDESVYVGDIATDVIAAKRAGIMSIAVTYGFNSRDVLAKEHPDHIVDSPDDLFKLLSRICS